MKKKPIFKRLVRGIKKAVATPEIPDLSEDHARCCQNCKSDMVVVSGQIEHINFETGDIYLPARCEMCGEPGFAQYSMTKYVEGPTVESKEDVCYG